MFQRINICSPSSLNFTPQWSMGPERSFATWFCLLLRLLLQPSFSSLALIHLKLSVAMLSFFWLPVDSITVLLLWIRQNRAGLPLFLLFVKYIQYCNNNKYCRTDINIKKGIFMFSGILFSKVTYTLINMLEWISQSSRGSSVQLDLLMARIQPSVVLQLSWSLYSKAAPLREHLA
jgi:hypothetical protein